jgi:hypothetical protein
MNLPLYLRVVRGEGVSSLFFFISEIQSLTTERIPFNAFSEVDANQLRLGNSAHKPINSSSSSDHNTRYVYLSLSRTMIHLDFINGKYYLSNLVGLSCTFMILNIYTWVVRPWCFIDIMTTTALVWFFEIMCTSLLKIIETKHFGVCFHFF